jgi:two-component system NtrC family sensor kinase
MTLRKKMVIATSLLILSLLWLAGASLYGLHGLSTNLGVALEEYEELRVIEELSVHMAMARGSLSASAPDLPMVTAQLREAVEKLESFVSLQEAEIKSGPEHQGRETAAVEPIVGGLYRLLDRLMLATTAQKLSPTDRAGLTAAINVLLDDVDDLIKQMDSAVYAAQMAAHQKLRRTILMMAVLSSLITLMGVLVGVIQYRSVILPLRRLRSGVRQIASGQLDQRVVVGGDKEFVELAQDFNTMTGELEKLYHDLEQRVATKSKQLARSERLASVGFLAAGVAHEINNPLSIISGYAELSLKQLRRLKDTRDTAEPVEALRIIRDESFRCKQIIEKLLSLTHKTDAPRSAVDLLQVIDDVASMVAGLKKYHHCSLELAVEPHTPLLVTANEAEMKQVLLNLVVNALEAVEADSSGLVHIQGQRDNGWVELSVADNGRGMARETLDHVFEPFFTEKRGHGEQGTGLGLSIVHAIIEDHGGRIEAHSDGPGKGSRFTIQVPVMEDQAVDEGTGI